MKRKNLVLGVAGMAALGVVAVAGPAMAAAPYKITVGGSAPATGTTVNNITAASTGGVAFSTKNGSNPVVSMSCTSVSGAGTVKSGNSVANPIGSITSTTWNTCNIPGGIGDVTQVGTWNLNGTGNATSAQTDNLAGTVSGVKATVKLRSNPALCNFTVEGSARGTLKEAGSPQQLQFAETGYTGNLKVTQVQGCGGKIVVGDPADFSTLLNLTSPNGAINVIN